MPYSTIWNDKTKMEVDAIVDVTNTVPQMGGGVCRVIFTAAGAERLQAACDAYAPIFLMNYLRVIISIIHFVT